MEDGKVEQGKVEEGSEEKVKVKVEEGKVEEGREEKVKVEVKEEEVTPTVPTTEWGQQEERGLLDPGLERILMGEADWQTRRLREIKKERDEEQGRKRQEEEENAYRIWYMSLTDAEIEAMIE